MWRSIFSGIRGGIRSHSSGRWYSPSRPEQPSSFEQQAAVRRRFDRFIERSPRFLRPSLTGLRKAPVSHIVAFVILHELTAVVPLFGLAGAFHYWRWLPPSFAEGAWVSGGMEKFARYFRKKGWISERDEREVEQQRSYGDAGSPESRPTALEWFNAREDATRWVLEFATAYAVVKVLLPVRIIVSVWGSPWFARWAIIPIGNATRSVFRRTKG